MTLLDEIRNLVQAQDLDKFDALRERREMRQRQGFLPESFSTLSLDSQSDRHVHAHRPRSERSFKVNFFCYRFICSYSNFPDLVHSAVYILLFGPLRSAEIF